MTRLQRTLPKHCLHKATGQGYVRFKGCTKAFYTGKFGTPKAEAVYDRLIQKYVAGGRKPPDETPRGEQTIADLAAAFWSYFIKQHPSSLEPNGLRLTLKPFLAMFGSFRVSEFSSLHLIQVQEEMIQRGLTRTHINSRITRLKRMFTWGASMQIFPASAMLEIKAVEGLRRGRSDAKESKVVRPVEQDHVDAVLPLVSRQVAAMIQVQLLSAMRPGEVLIMRGVDIDRSGEVWWYAPSAHKNKHREIERTVPIGPLGQALLRPFLLRPDTAYLFSPKEAEEERRRDLAAARKSKVSPSQRKRQLRWTKPPRSKLGGCYPIATFRRAIARACKIAEIPRWSPNQLRHLAATRIREVYGLDHAQAILGHTTARTTEIYAEVSQSKAERVSSEMG